MIETNQSAPDTPEIRSAIYRQFAAAFLYPGAGTSNPAGLTGAEYCEAFDPAVSENACSLRAARYMGQEQTALFEELMRFYEFFGLTRSEHAEIPDHISIELEFMHFLTYLESQASGDPEGVESLRRAQRDFLNRHLGRLIQGIRKDIKSEAVPTCAELVELCGEFIDTEIANLN